MSEEALRGLIAYRLQQAAEALEEALLLLEAAHWRASVNRSYYAMFYAVQALLASHGFKTSRHSGAIALFDREFVKPLFFPREFSKWLHELFDLRQDADYGDMVQVSQDQAQHALAHARAFVQSIHAHFEKNSPAS